MNLGIKSGRAAAVQTRRKREFVFYFLEQLGALLGTWMQNLALGWIVHAAPVSLHAAGFLSPQIAGILTMVCSAATWMLLTVWGFKIREHFRKFSRFVKILKSEISSARRSSLVNWAKRDGCPCA